MSTTFADISGALDSRLDAFTGSDPVAWPNTPYKPVKDTLFLRPTVLPATAAQSGLGASGLDTHTGIYQIDVFAATGDGRGAAEVKADALADHFKRGTDLTYNGLTVRLGNVSRSSGVVNDDRFVISLSVNYLVHATPR